MESLNISADATSGLTEKEKWVLRGGIGFFQKVDLGSIKPDGPDLDHFVAVLNGQVEPCTSEEIAYLKLRHMDEDAVRMVLTDHVGETIAKHRQILKKAEEKQNRLEKRRIEEPSSKFGWLYNEPYWDEVDHEELRLIQEDLFDDSLELARSHEEGWPYDDEDR